MHATNVDKAAEPGRPQGTTATTYELGRAVRRDQQASVLTRILGDPVGEGLASPPESGA